MFRGTQGAMWLDGHTASPLLEETSVVLAVSIIQLPYQEQPMQLQQWKMSTVTHIFIWFISIVST